MTADTTHVWIDAAGVTLHALAAGLENDGPLVLMIHGFPGSAYAWRHQMAPLAAAGYRAVAVDCLGYGRSDRPLDQALYTSEAARAQLTGVIDHFGDAPAFVIGQDFGAQHAWNLAVRSPDRVRALITTIPYDYDLCGRAMLGGAARKPEGDPASPDCASPDDLPSERFAAMAARHFVHLHYFQAVGPAEAELGPRLAEFLRRDYHALSAAGDLWSWTGTAGEGAGYLDALPPAPPLPWPWLSEAEFDRYVADFAHPDPARVLIGGLASYRAADDNWRIGARWADADVHAPTLFVHGAHDPSFGFFPDWRARMVRRVPGLRRLGEIEGAGHFVQQERPAAFNRAMLDFLAEQRR
ncbi:MAG: alpha/beta hydrolase [Sphingomonas sp.]